VEGVACTNLKPARNRSSGQNSVRPMHLFGLYRDQLHSNPTRGRTNNASLRERCLRQLGRWAVRNHAVRDKVNEIFA